MRIQELVNERRSNPKINPKRTFRQEIMAIVDRHGGELDRYWISSSLVDRLGFYGGDSSHPRPEVTRPGRALVVPTRAFSGQIRFHSPEYATYGGADYTGIGKPQESYGVWFMPLTKSLELLERGQYPYLRNYLFLVKQRDTAWLQPVNSLQRLRANIVGISPPRGQEKVGQYNPSTGIAVFFRPAYDVVGRWTRDELSRSVARNRDIK